MPEGPGLTIISLRNSGLRIFFKEGDGELVPTTRGRIPISEVRVGDVIELCSADCRHFTVADVLRA